MGEWEKQIIDFLKGSRSNAFTSEEIMRGINYPMDYRDFWGALLTAFGFWGTLEGLVKKGEIRRKKINNTDYYIIR